MPFSIGPKDHNHIPAGLKNLIEGFFSIQDWKGLCLTGGTCLAEYYLGHRQSDDVDLFTSEEILFREARRAILDMPRRLGGAIEELRSTPFIVQFHYRTAQEKDPIKIDLVLDLPIRIAPMVFWKGLWLDSLEDILCNKLGCLVSRNAVKDFLDLYYLIPASHLTTKELIETGLKKEGGLDPVVMANQIEWVLEQPTPAASLLGKTDWAELQLFFKKFQKECLDLIRPSS